MERVKFLFLGFFIGILTGFPASAQKKLPGPYNKKETALVIIDIQYFYFPGGSLPLVAPEKASHNAAKLLAMFRKQGMLVVHVKHNAKSGAEIFPDVKPIDGEKIITKNEANSFAGTDLLNYLLKHKIKNLVLAGMQTQMCLEATTRAAYDYGFNCTVVDDACATRDLKFGDHVIKAKDVHYATLASLSGYYARVTTTENLLKELTQ